MPIIAEKFSNIIPFGYIEYNGIDLQKVINNNITVFEVYPITLKRSGITASGSIAKGSTESPQLIRLYFDLSDVRETNINNDYLFARNITNTPTLIITLADSVSETFTITLHTCAEVLTNYTGGVIHETTYDITIPSGSTSSDDFSVNIPDIVLNEPYSNNEEDVIYYYIYCTCSTMAPVKISLYVVAGDDVATLNTAQ